MAESDNTVKASETRDCYQRWQMEVNTCEPDYMDSWVKPLDWFIMDKATRLYK